MLLRNVFTENDKIFSWKNNNPNMDTDQKWEKYNPTKWWWSGLAWKYNITFSIRKQFCKDFGILKKREQLGVSQFLFTEERMHFGCKKKTKLLVNAHFAMFKLPLSTE